MKIYAFPQWFWIGLIVVTAAHSLQRRDNMMQSRSFPAISFTVDLHLLSAEQLKDLYIYYADTKDLRDRISFVLQKKCPDAFASLNEST